MRVVITSLCFVAFAASAAAQEQAPPSAGVLDQVYACAGVTDQAQRLACYDGAVGRLQQAQNSGQIVAVDREQVEQLERESFGFSLPSLPRLFADRDDDGSQETAVEAMQLLIDRVVEREVRDTLIYMSNGQVWEVTDGHNRNARAGAQVEIRRGALGSFMMSFDAGGSALRVRRRQ